MKKRIFSIVLSLCMVLALLPQMVFAEESGTAEELQNLLDKGGLVKLDRDYTIDTTLNVTNTVTLDLNGHVIKMTGDYGVFCIYNNFSLTLEDSDSTATHTDASLPAGGVITGGKAKDVGSGDGHGGGVLNGGTFTMNGGTITGCSAEANGGGVLNGGTFTMNGGTITGCSAKSYGGGVHNTDSFTMNGGAITDCSAGLSGGGVYNETAKAPNIMRANGGEIKGLFNNAARLTISKENDASGTTFTGDVTNRLSKIDAGIYMGTVTNDKGISDTNGGTISGGIFKGTVINTKGSTISGGMFYGGIENNGIISGNKVTFMNGNIDYAIEVVAGGNQVVAPVEPTQDGYTFTGWYTDEELTQQYAFGYALSEDITLYAGWDEIITLTVQFTTTVKQGGNVAPGKTTFNLQVVDRQGNKQVINDVEVTASITTNGVGDYKGTMTLTGPSQRFYDMFDNGGIFVQQVNAGEANWTYDDTVWCLLPSAVAMSSTDDAAPGNTISIYPTGFEESDDGGRFYYPNWDKNPVSNMTFTNTYTKSIADSSDAEGTTSEDSNNDNGNDNKSKADAEDSAKTGDDSNLALWLALLAVSAAGAAGTCVYSKRRRSSRAK